MATLANDTLCQDQISARNSTGTVLCLLETNYFGKYLAQVRIASSGKLFCHIRFRAQDRERGMKVMRFSIKLANAVMSRRVFYGPRVFADGNFMEFNLRKEDKDVG